jgi:SEC-C motif-containing protein
MEKDTSAACPCGSKKPYSTCCQPYHSGKALPPTAESLMRARYSAYAMGEVTFVQKSTHPSKLADFDFKASQEWSNQAEWKELKILATEAGGPSDSKGMVAFEAHFKMQNKDEVYAERALFERHGPDKKWYFFDGKAISNDPVKREEPKVGRNDPCPCGSGQKYKKCCG